MGFSFGFRPRLLPTLAAIAGITITVMLGNWQLGRAAQKTALQQRIESAARQPPVQLTATTAQADQLAYYPAQVEGDAIGGLGGPEGVALGLEALVEVEE